MCLKLFIITILIPIVYCENEENTVSSRKDNESSTINSLRPAERECQQIIKSYEPSLGDYIVGGEEALLGEFPHMMALGYNTENGYQFDCGGAVVSTKYVITAAHCVRTINPLNPSIVRGGVVKIGGKVLDPKTDTKIANIVYHPEYHPRRKYNDLALLELVTELIFTANFNAICLDTSNEEPKVPVTITGWGKTGYLEPSSDVLLKTTLKIASRDVCAKAYKGTPRLPSGIIEDQMCAGDSEGYHDTCQGDSGGPLIIPAKEGHSRLVGVTSFGRLCGTIIPGVYTRVNRYLDWIESVVWPK